MTDISQQLVNTIDQLRKSLDQLRDELVRKDVFLEVQNNIAARFKALEDDLHGLERRIDRTDQDNKATRRLYLAVFIGPAVMIVLAAYIYAQVGGSPT
jgi:hypothetical protein